VGSVNRYRDFDQAFLPARASMETRWKRIDWAFHRAAELPPVSPYKIGERYSYRTAITASAEPATKASR
jgi:hypothetical protein